MSDLARIPDPALAYLIRQLEAKTAALKLSNTASSRALYEQMQDRLAEVRAEISRRRV
jgi:hypothetical protein